MKQKDYNRLSGFIFMAFAVFHGLRIISDWPITIGPWRVPIQASVGAFIIGLYLAVQAYRYGR